MEGQPERFDRVLKPWNEIETQSWKGFALGNLYHLQAVDGRVLRRIEANKLSSDLTPSHDEDHMLQGRSFAPGRNPDTALKRRPVEGDSLLS